MCWCMRISICLGRLGEGGGITAKSDHALNVSSGRWCVLIAKIGINLWKYSTMGYMVI